MGDKKFPIRLKYRAVAVGPQLALLGLDRVESEILKRNRILACQSIAFRNQTGQRGNVEIYLRQGEFYVFICDQTTPAADRWYWYPYAQFIKLGEQITAFQATCEADDILDLHIIGYTTYGEENVLPRGGQ